MALVSATPAVRSHAVPELSSPTTRVHASYLAAVAEYQAEGGYPDFDDLSIDAPEAFALYVEQLRADPRAYYQPTLPPITLLWWVDAEEYLGRISIWHRLSSSLVGTGHVGYDVRPSARRLGHATAMLAAALPVMGRLGIDPAVVTARSANVASRKVIEANSGLLVNQREGRLHFHIPTRSR
jgi:predicted acetyltransferase